MTSARSKDGADKAADTVILKKYGNRRLYDTSASRYVTLAEVETMVQKGTDIQVKDAKTGGDITKEILVQLLLERDGARAALPTGLLKQAVRLANSPLKDGLVKAMQEGLDGFMASQRAVIDAQRALTSQLGQMNPWLQSPVPAAAWNPFPPPTTPSAAPPSPASAQAPAPASAPASTPASTSTPPAQGPSDLQSLQAELQQTQALVAQLLQRELARSDHEAHATATMPPVTPATKATKATKAAKAKGPSAKKKAAPKKAAKKTKSA